jgi:hypothetical protein
MNNKNDELASMITNYASIALRYIVTKDKKYLDMLDIQHNKIKEFIGA